MKKNKIWCISKYASPESYGPSTKLYNTAMYLSAFHNLTLITSNANQKATYPNSNLKINVEQIKTLRHVWINLPKFHKSRSFKRLFGWFMFDNYVAKLPKELDEIPDIILISSLPLTTIHWALSMKKRYGTKVIFEVRDIYPLTLTEMGYSKFNPIIMYFAYLEKIGYKYSDLIVGTMSQLSIHVEKILGYKKETFYSPIGLSPLFQHNAIKKLDLGIHSNKIIIGYVGSIGRANNLDIFIDVINYFNTNDQIHFLIVGDGEFLDIYRNKTGTNCTFYGYIPPNDVHIALNTCNILYFSTSDSQVMKYGQSLNKLKEYLASGKPIVASYEGYLEDYLKEAGIYYCKINDVRSLIFQIKFVMKFNSIELKKISIKNKAIVSTNFEYDSLNKKYHSLIEYLSAN